MKKTIKLLGLIAMAALLFSCEKKLDNNVTPGGDPTQTPVENTELDPGVYLLSFGARFENDTKVAINVTDGTQSFEDGDEVLVHCPATGASATYKYNGSLFVPAGDAIAAGSKVIHVYYPASEFAASSGDVTFTMPDAIEAGSAEDLGDKVPMAGILPAGNADDPVVTFKNLGSILHVRFNSSAEEGETITAVELSVEGANITGSGDIRWSGDTAEAVPSVADPGLDGTTSIRIDVNDVHLNGTDYKEYFFFLPASGTLTEMSVKAIYGKTGGFEPSETVSRTSEMPLERKKIYKVQKSLKGFFSGGDGSETYPYQIASADDFKAIATLANATAAADGNGYNATASRTFFGSADVHYMQTATIDIDKAELTPIGNETTPFAGYYDGSGNGIKNDIKNIVINASANNAGVIGYLNCGTVKNLNVSGTVSSTANQVGGIVGYMAGGTIEACSFSGKVIGNAQVGGIVGDAGLASSLSANNICKITACRVNADVESELNGASNVGGIAGRIRHSVIVNSCYAKGTVKGAGYNIGGLVGQMVVNVANAVGRSYMFDCLANMNVTATRSAGENVRLGGAVGYILNSYTSTASTAPYVGVDNCVVAPVTITASGNNVGGFVGALKGYTADTATDMKNRLRLRNNCTFVSSVPGGNGFMGTREDGQMTLQYNYCAMSTDAFFQIANADLPAGVIRQNCGRSRTYASKAAELCTTFNANTYNLTINGVTYTSALEWAAPDDIEYIVPGALKDLGEDYYK